ncbi:MAG: hypothetical protein P8X89_08370 [Reinekea sp.]
MACALRRYGGTDSGISQGWLHSAKNRWRHGILVIRSLSDR